MFQDPNLGRMYVSPKESTFVKKPVSSDASLRSSASLFGLLVKHQY